MRRLLILAAVLFPAIVMTCSCSKEHEDYPIAINVTATGSVKGNVFTDDKGLAYNIGKADSDVKVRDMERALASFDVLEKTGDREYSILLHYLYEPLCKEITRLSEAEEGILADDPIIIRTGWVSGGYLNLNFSISYLNGSDASHMIGLVLDDSQPLDTLRFTFRHNGYGEGFADEGNRSSYSEGSGFVCFDVRNMVPDGKDSIPFTITAPWYETIGDDIRTGGTINLVTRGQITR